MMKIANKGRVLGSGEHLGQHLHAAGSPLVVLFAGFDVNCGNHTVGVGVSEQSSCSPHTFLSQTLGTGYNHQHSAIEGRSSNSSILVLSRHCASPMSHRSDNHVVSTITRKEQYQVSGQILV